MKLLRETGLLFMRSMRSTLRSPTWALIGLFQPLCYLLLFAPLLDGVSKVPGFPPGGALTVYTPGVLVMMGIFSAAFTGFGVISEVRLGVIERFQVTPVSRMALLLGQVLRDVLLLLMQSLLLVLIAWPMGAHINLPGVLLTFVLIALLGICLTSCSYALALKLKNENALSSLLNTFSLPIVLLSGITLPLTLAPQIMRTIALFNPFAYVVNASRMLFNGHLSDSSVLQAFTIMLILACLAILWARSAFNQPIV